MSVTSQAEKARQSALKLQGYSTDDKNKVLSAIAEGISAYKDFIIAENKKDLDIFPDKTSALFDRLLLNEKRVMQMVEGVKAVIDLKDPVGEVTAEWDRPSGLHIKKVRAHWAWSRLFTKPVPTLPSMPPFFALKAATRRYFAEADRR